MTPSTLPPRRSLPWPALLVTAILVTLAALALTQRNPTMSRSTPLTKDQAYADMLTFAEQHLQLQRIDCGEIESVRPDTPCYVTDLAAEEVPAALENLPDLQPVTAWRDDYGVLSAGFAWKDTPYELGVVYARASLEDYKDRADIREHQGLVTIAIDDK